MMCSLVQRLGGGTVGPRHALIGGTFWVGAALIALLALYLRLFSRSESPLRGRLRTAVLLLAVTGLDILPTLFFLILYAAGIFGVVLPSVEWWNQQLAWFVFTTLWTPHAIAALIACFTGFLLIWHAPAAKGRLGILRYALPGAMGLASSFGASIWVMFVFGAFLLIWTAIAVCKRWFRDVLALAIAGVAAAVLILPYLRELSGPGLRRPAGHAYRSIFFLGRRASTPAASTTPGGSSSITALCCRSIIFWSSAFSCSPPAINGGSAAPPISRSNARILPASSWPPPAP